MTIDRLMKKIPIEQNSACDKRVSMSEVTVYFERRQERQNRSIKKRTGTNSAHENATSRKVNKYILSGNYGCRERENLKQYEHIWLHRLKTHHVIKPPGHRMRQRRQQPYRQCWGSCGVGLEGGRRHQVRSKAISLVMPTKCVSGEPLCSLL